MAKNSLQVTMLMSGNGILKGGVMSGYWSNLAVIETQFDQQVKHMCQNQIPGLYA